MCASESGNEKIPQNESESENVGRREKAEENSDVNVRGHHDHGHHASDYRHVSENFHANVHVRPIEWTLVPFKSKREL